MDQPAYFARLRSITLSLIITGLSLIPTLYVAVISNSLTLFADLLRCCVEFLSILIAFIIIRQTHPENLKNYNYGFSKLEHFSSLMVAAAMLVAFLITTYAATKRLIYPTAVENTEMGLYLGILSVLGNLFMWQKNIRLNRKSFSPIIAAQARLFLSKTVACLVVVISLTSGFLFQNNFIGHYADTIGSFCVAAFLLYSSYNIIFLSLGKILDAALEEGAQLLILKALVKFESRYKNIARIRSRHAETNFIELSLEFDETLPLSEVHKTSLLIQKEIEGLIPATEVVIIPLPA